MQRLEVSGAVRPIYGSLGVKRLINYGDREILFSMARRPTRSHSDTPHSVGLLWTSDQPDAETSI